MRVWVVTETNRITGHTTLYGAFTSEEAARKDYSDEDENYMVNFVWLEVVA